MNKEKYISELKNNINRLKEDAEYLLVGKRKKSALFSYITLTEEIVKLLDYYEHNKVRKPGNHFQKLSLINNFYKQIEDKIKEPDLLNTLSNKLKTDLESILDCLIDEEPNPELKEKLMEVKQNANSEQLVKNIENIYQKLIGQFGNSLERFYSDRIRGLCLYVDWSHPSLTEDELDTHISTYQKVTDAFLIKLNQQS